jgi:hypothetical protein
MGNSMNMWVILKTSVNVTAEARKCKHINKCRFLWFIGTTQWLSQSSYFHRKSVSWHTSHSLLSATGSWNHHHYNQKRICSQAYIWQFSSTLHYSAIKFIGIIFKNSVPCSQKTHWISNRWTNKLIQLSSYYIIIIIDLYSENNTLWVKSGVFNTQVLATYNNQCALKPYGCVYIIATPLPLSWGSEKRKEMRSGEGRDLFAYHERHHYWSEWVDCARGIGNVGG